MQVGDTTGSYRLEEFLGAGGFGRVWRARHVELGWVRALKVPHSVEAAERLRVEGQLVAQLEAFQHPNIVRLYDLNTRGENAYAVYEYVPGQDLAQRLRQGPLPVAEIQRIAEGVLEGLAAAHEHGLIHRDIKPSNILLGDDGSVKITDFGLGRAVEADTLEQSQKSGRTERSWEFEQSQISRKSPGQGEIIGTLAYMSPEQRKGREEITPATDLYSLGVVLYEGLTGDLPEGVFEPPQEARPGVPGPLSDLVAELLRKAP